MKTNTFNLVAAIVFFVLLLGAIFIPGMMSKPSTIDLEAQKRKLQSETYITQAGEHMATATALIEESIKVLTPQPKTAMLGSAVYAAEATGVQIVPTATVTEAISGSQGQTTTTASNSNGTGGSVASVMHISEQGIAMIKKYEGFRSCAYWDIKMWTIGYGSAGKKGQCISEVEADKILRDQVYVKEIAVHRLVKVALTQQQYDSLVSFTYNMGAGALEGSDLLKTLNAGKYNEVPAQLARWVHGGGQKLGGLVKRRAEEAKAF
ncbi:MAG: lysozyme [bacterium]